MVDGARRGFHHTHRNSRVQATQAARMGIDFRHNPLPRRLSQAKRQRFKAHRRHGFACLFNLVRYHRLPACLHKRTRDGYSGRVNHCRCGKHRSQHNVATAQNQKEIRFYFAKLLSHCHRTSLPIDTQQVAV